MKNKSVTNYLSLVKFSHTIFAMPFALMGYCLAAHHFGFELRLLLLVVLCMVLARNSAMGFNRLVDYRIDSLNPRTVNREIPAGIIPVRSALIFVLINAIGFIVTTYFINHLVLFLSPVALFVVLGYSYTKRFTWLCHLVLGVGLSLAPLGAYLAISGQWSLVPIYWSIAVLFWVSGFDILYALQDIDFDKSQRLNSIPVQLGVKNSLRLSIVFHLITVLFVALAFFQGNFGLLYIIGAVIFFALLTYQHLIVKADDFSRLNLAFFTTNGVASVIFAVFVILDIFFHIAI